MPRWFDGQCKLAIFAVWSLICVGAGQAIEKYWENTEKCSVYYVIEVVKPEVSSTISF